MKATDTIKEIIMNDTIQETIKPAGVKVAQFVSANVTAWTITFADINNMLTSLSLIAATTFSLYLLFCKIRDESKKRQEEQKVK